MKTKNILWILSLFLLVSIVFAIEFKDKSYILSLNYDNGIISKDELIIVNLPPSNNFNQPEEGYRLDILSINDEVIHNIKFNFPLEVNSAQPLDLFDEDSNQLYVPTKQILTESSITLSMPYFSEAKEIKIYDKDDILKLSIDASEFLSCNLDNICQIENNENFKLCPSDCKREINIWVYIIAGIAVVILSILAFILLKRKGGKKWLKKPL